MPGERSHEIRSREGPLREEAVDRTGRRGRLEQEDDDRTIHSRTVQMNMRLEDTGDVVDLQPEMDGPSVLVHPEDGAAGGERGAGRRRITRDHLAATSQGRLEAFVPK